MTTLEEFLINLDEPCRIISEAMTKRGLTVDETVEFGRACFEAGKRAPLLVKMLRELLNFDSTSDMKVLLDEIANGFLKEAKA
jgi:hypothetical protein